MSDLKLYYSPGACSLAPHIALEEAGAAFEPVRVDFAAGQQRSPDYLAINPKGRVPAIVDGGFVLTENPAILRYIAGRYPGAALWPDEPQEAARCAERLAWFSSAVHVAYAHVRRAERYASSESAQIEVRETGLATCRDLWRQIEAGFGGGPWLLGQHFSVADPYLFVFWNWGRGAALGFDMASQFPTWTAHARRMGERPAVARVLAREGLQAP